MPMRFAVGLECRIVVVGCTSTILNLHTSVDVVANQWCMLEECLIAIPPNIYVCYKGLLLKRGLL